MLFTLSHIKNKLVASGQRHPILAPLIAALFALGLLLVPIIHSAATSSPNIPLFDPNHFTAEQLATSTLNDGIPDVWKIYYGLSTTDATIANADYTGSGIMNAEKYQLNLYPLALADPPAPATPNKKTSSAAKSAAKDAPAGLNFTNGSFTSVTLGTNNNNKWSASGAAGYRDGKFGSFSWNYIDSTKGGKVDGWRAYKGNIIEIWKIEGKQFV